MQLTTSLIHIRTMSTPKDTTNVEEKSSRARRVSNSNSNSRRRRPVNAGGKKNDDEDKEETNEKAGETGKEKPKRPSDIPVPPELIGTEVTGKIFDILRRYNASYGFILINSETSPKNQKPKIYFNMKDYGEADFIARKGYEVQFSVSKDERDRLCATNITLTPEGKVAAVAREERIAKYKEEEAAAGGAAGTGDKKKFQRKNDVPIPLTVTCDGKTETKTVEVRVFQSIGRLKHACIEAFDVPLQYSIYCQRTKENPEGILLTKTILKQMKEGDNVHLGPLVALPAADDA